MARATQCERIIKYIEDFGSITSLDAMKDLGVMRLASRINEIKKMGYVIKAVTEKGKNRYQEPTHYTRYFICK